MSRRNPYFVSNLKSLLGKAVHGWRMVAHHDEVLVGLSGGKDSLTMLKLLAERRRHVPIDFNIRAAHIEMGFNRVDHKALEEFCAGLGVEFTLISTDFGVRAHTDENREKSPCFFCAMHRRRELFQLAQKLGCNKLAFAHHQDDLNETLLINLLYAGSIATMLPVQPFFGGKLTVIRPLALINSAQTRRYARRLELPVQPPCCDSASEGKRAQVRQVLESFYRGNKKVRASLWAAMTGAGLDSLPAPPDMSPLPLPDKE